MLRYFLLLDVKHNVKIELDPKQFTTDTIGIYNWSAWSVGEEIFDFENSKNPIFFHSYKNNEVTLKLGNN